MSSDSTLNEPTPEQFQGPLTKLLIDDFVIAGEPVPKARARFTRIGNASRTYTPQRTIDAEKAVLRAWGHSHFQAMSGLGTLATDTYELRCDFYLGTKRRKDIDNLVKLVQDALNGHAYIDDSQIVELTARKHFVPKTDAQTRVRLYVFTSYIPESHDHINFSGGLINTGETS